MFDELDLIRRAQMGEQEAFTELVRMHQSRVRAYIGRYIRAADEVDDLAQEVFLTAYRSIGSYEGRSALSTWLIGIAKHRTLTYRRDEARRRERETRTLETAMITWRLEAAESSGAGEAEADCQVNALRGCLEKLPAGNAALVQAHYFKGRSTAEIAKAQGKKGSAVRTTLMRVRRVLRDCVEGRLREDGLLDGAARIPY